MFPWFISHKCQNPCCCSIKYLGVSLPWIGCLCITGLAFQLRLVPFIPLMGREDQVGSGILLWDTWKQYWSWWDSTPQPSGTRYHYSTDPPLFLLAGPKRHIHSFYRTLTITNACENHHCEKHGNTQISPNLSHKL
jgi:hypothetical protein